MKRVSDEIRNRRKDYLDSRPLCEYFDACGSDFDARVWTGLEGTHRYRRQPTKPTEVHHIFGRGGPGDISEHPSNYLAVSRHYHAWATEQSVEGRIVALWWKWLHREKEPEGFDLDVLHSVFGKDLIGWVSNKLETTDLPTWVRTRGEEVLDDSN